MSKMTILAVLIVLFMGIAIGYSYQNMQKQLGCNQNNGESTPSVIPSDKILDLSNKGLTQAPSYVFSETQIEELNLSGNKLTGALPAEIRHLQNLKILNAGNNQMTGVPAEIGQLSKLEVLDLSNNKLTGLPYELGNLKNLKILKLAGNDYSRQDLDIIRKGLSPSVIIE